MFWEELLMEKNNFMQSEFYIEIPKQHQDVQPGIESQMNPRPVFYHQSYNKVSSRLKGKVSLITGGDSGIGRAVALAFAREGANVAIIYFNEDLDANETKTIIEKFGGKCIVIKGDISDENFCNSAIERVINEFNKLDILVNNSAVQFSKNTVEEITAEQLQRTFAVNVFGAFYLTKASLKHLKEGSSIINTTSVTAYHGSETLLDYSSTKGALVSFTRSLALNLAPRRIRVNAVAPGPIWTPLIPSSFDENKTSQFGKNVPLGRPGQPVEVAGAYVFLASDDASYITGQAIHINGGEIVNG